MSHASCVGTDFTNANLDAANMHGVDLRAATMEHATMAGVNATTGFDTMVKQHAAKDAKGKESEQGRER